ncbi:MAG: hypothetical protein ABS69_11575 [Nitrosomonadales bacterium SCN 54-20]|nr:MAG: hypothetical protein ABS69_11575 [Nitrosomonadales bacterium SCN 54-20]
MSAPEIDFNKLRANGLEYASNQLWEAAQVIAGELDLRESPEEIIRKHPVHVLGVALLAHLDERAEERRIMKEAELEILREIEQSLITLAIAGSEMLVGELKENWLKVHPNYTPEELSEAMNRFDSMAFGSCRARNNDK